MRFWDSSAMVPLVVRDSSTDEAMAMMRADRDFAVWWATPVECASALTRVVRDGSLGETGLEAALARLDALLERGSVIEPCDTIRAEARRLLRVHPLRAADALQLAAAIEMRGSPSMRQHLVTYDQRLATAARREGFTVN